MHVSIPKNKRKLRGSGGLQALLLKGMKCQFKHKHWNEFASYLS